MFGEDLEIPAAGLGRRGASFHPQAPVGAGRPTFRRMSGPLGLTGAGVPAIFLQATTRAEDGDDAGAKDKSESKEISIRYGPNAGNRKLSEYTLDVLKAIVKAAGLRSVVVSGASRTPAVQAQVMYENLEAHGVLKQKRIYGREGMQVIEVYARLKTEQRTRKEILAAMRSKIKRYGCTRVLNHRNSGVPMQAVDLDSESIGHSPRFMAAVLAEERVISFLRPPKAPAYCLDIPQPAPSGPLMKEEAPPPPSKAVSSKEEKKTWIEFKVVDDGTDKPVPGVRLRVVLPGGTERFFTTNSDGLVRIEDIDPGSCDISEVIDKEALEVVEVS